MDMMKEEFLEKLQHELSSELEPYKVQENIRYYAQYIQEEMNNGKTESEVLEMLGDPWVLSKTIIDAQDGTDEEVVYEAQRYEYRNREQELNDNPKTKVFMVSRWRVILTLLGVLLLIFAVLSLITGLIGLLLPVIIPILIVVLIIRLIQK